VSGNGAGGIGLGVGASGFVEAHGLYSDEQRAAATEVAAKIAEAGLRTVRIVIVDQHGLPRTKHLSTDAAISAMRNGSDFSGAIYSLDTGNCVFPPAFAQGGGFGIDEFTGFPDISVVPDPTTFRILPWADRTGWMLCDAYFSNGKPLPLDGRALMRAQLARLADRGYRCFSGLEVEFYVTRYVDEGRIALDGTGQPGPAPEVDVVERGYQFLSDFRLDGAAAILEPLRDGLWDVGLPPRSMEDEWGPGQFEFTFSPLEGLAAADAMILFRSTMKAVCARRGLLASFMCWPQLPNFFPSGWHLHQSLADASGANAFVDEREVLSPLGLQWVAGLLDHAKAMTVFGDPTVNAYHRFRPYSFAPDRIGWAVDNRGALVRIQGGPGDASTHVENRMSEPAANPYLWMAANIAAGLDGIERNATPPPIVVGDPYAEEAELLPQTLEEAADELDRSGLYRTAFGDPLVDYIVMMKRAEVARYAAVGGEPEARSAWEMNEYFEIY
jgi:glutamine synthetase